MSLTKGQLRALDLLLKSEDREIVCDGLVCMIDRHTIAARTVLGLLQHMAIKDAGYAGVNTRIYCPTGNSAAILKRPALADEMLARVIAQRPFTIDAEGNIKDMP